MPDVHEAVEQATSRGRTRLEDSSTTVTVACKLPNGLILQLEDPHTVNEPLPNGGYREVKQWRRRPEQYTLNGCAINFESLKRQLAMPAIENGFALTSGIPKDFWDRWWEAHKGDDICKRGLVFATGSEYETRKETANRRNVRGIEPIDPDNPSAIGNDVRRVQVGTTTAE